MSTADRIAALRAEGEAAVAAAASTADLEEVRVRFLGRKAELPNLLRGVAELAPEERGPVGRPGGRRDRGYTLRLELLDPLPHARATLPATS